MPKFEFETPKNPSSMLTGILHDAANETLTVQFKGGKIGHYANVSADMYYDLFNAESPGKYLHSVIKSDPDSFPFRYEPTEEEAS